jgi:hypothetical protein
MVRTCQINGNKFLIKDGWKLSRSINTQTSFSVTIIDNPTLSPVELGMDVQFFDVNLIWAGIITDIRRYEIIPNHLYYDLTISSYESILNRIRVSGVWEGSTAGLIMFDILNNYLVNDGIIFGYMMYGFSLDKVVSNYKTAYDLFNYLCEASPGFNWSIGFDKKLNFYHRETFKAETIINSDFVHYNFNIKETLNEYRNVQYLEGGLKKTVLQSNYVPSPKPDGTSRDFTLRFPVAEEPIVETNIGGAGWVTKTIGINGINTGKDFYYTYNSKTISQDSSGTVLGTSDLIRVTYYGLTTVRMAYEDITQIADRKAVEKDSSGRYEHFFTDKTIESTLAAANYCKGLITKYSDNKVVELSVDYTLGDLELNKLVFIDKPLYNIYDWYLVESIDTYYQNAEYVSYDIKLLSGESLGGWEDYFKKLTATYKEVNTSDILIKFKDMSENIQHNGMVIVLLLDCIYPSDDLYPSDTLYPSSSDSVGDPVYPSNVLYPANDLYPAFFGGGIKLYD